MMNNAYPASPFLWSLISAMRSIAHHPQASPDGTCEGQLLFESENSAMGMSRSLPMEEFFPPTADSVLAEHFCCDPKALSQPRRSARMARRKRDAPKRNARKIAAEVDPCLNGFCRVFSPNSYQLYRNLRSPPPLTLSPTPILRIANSPSMREFVGFGRDVLSLSMNCA